MSDLDPLWGEGGVLRKLSPFNRESNEGGTTVSTGKSTLLNPLDSSVVTPGPPGFEGGVGERHSVTLSRDGDDPTTPYPPSSTCMCGWTEHPTCSCPVEVDFM